MHKGITIPIVVLILVITMSLSAAIAFYADNLNKTDLELSTQAIAAEIATDLASLQVIVDSMSVSNNLKRTFKDIDKAGDVLESEYLLDAQQELEAYLRLADNITLVWVVDLSSGDQIRSDYNLKGLTIDEYDATAKEWYEPTVSSDVAIVTPPYVDAQSGELTTSIISVLRDGTEQLGVVGIDIGLDSIKNSVNSYQLGKTGYFVIVGNNNKIIYSSLATDNMDDPLDDSVVNALSTGKVKRGGIGYRTSVYDINKDWRVIGFYPESEYNSVLRMTILFCIVLTIISVLICIWLSSRCAAKVNAPVQEILAYSKRLMDGNFDEVANIEEGTELYDVSINLKKMSKGLSNYGNYIAEITENLNNFSQNNFSVSLKYDYAGEFASIKTALLDVESNISSFVSKVSESSDMVSDGADHVATASTELAQTCSTQAAIANNANETLSTYKEELNNTISSLEETKALAESEGVALEKSRTNIDEVISSIDAIASTANKIKDFVDIINNISGQTNLLSLNASIEAARAGGDGKGFAVVADEIRKLSDDCRNASEEIAALIEDTLKAVNASVATTESTNALQKDIFDKSSAESDALDITIELVRKQAEVCESLIESIGELNKAIQSNAATSQESSAVSEQLNAQISNLSELLGSMHI